MLNQCASFRRYVQILVNYASYFYGLEPCSCDLLLALISRYAERALNGNLSGTIAAGIQGRASALIPLRIWFVSEEVYTDNRNLLEDIF